MKVTVSIECETINELYAHFTELARQVKKRCKDKKANPASDEFTENDEEYLHDNNCYGTHEVEIRPDVPYPF